MTTGDIRTVVLRSIRRVAPETDPEEIDPAEPLRDQLDIDSMDFLNIVIGIHKETGIEIAEEDYPKLINVDAFVDYIEDVLARQASSAGRTS
jgi:acyl carrier protein